MRKENAPLNVNNDRMIPQGKNHNSISGNTTNILNNKQFDMPDTPTSATRRSGCDEDFSANVLNSSSFSPYAYCLSNFTSTALCLPMTCLQEKLNRKQKYHGDFDAFVVITELKL